MMPERFLHGPAFVPYERDLYARQVPPRTWWPQFIRDHTEDYLWSGYTEYTVAGWCRKTMIGRPSCGPRASADFDVVSGPGDR